MLNIVLINPEIPFNTGNIGRSCVATGTRLHLVGKLGFKIASQEIRRSGLDYWPNLDYVRYETWEDFLEQQQFACLLPLLLFQDMVCLFSLQHQLNS